MESMPFSWTTSLKRKGVVGGIYKIRVYPTLLSPSAPTQIITILMMLLSMWVVMRLHDKWELDIK